MTTKRAYSSENLPSPEEEHSTGFIVFDGRYYAALWKVELKAGNQLVAIYRDLPSDRWTIKSRMRVYSDDRIWGSSDEKRIDMYQAPEGQTEDQVVSKVDEILQELRVGMEKIGFPIKIHRVDVKSDVCSEIAGKIMTLPGMHAGTVDAKPGESWADLQKRAHKEMAEAEDLLKEAESKLGRPS